MEGDLPEGAGELAAYHRGAVKAVEACLAERGLEHERVTDPALGHVRREFAAVWEVELAADDWLQRVWLCVDARFPFSRPDIYACDRSLCLKIPHVEQTGRLCVIPSHGTFDPTNPGGVAGVVLDDARQLLADGFAGKNQCDFRDEFESYWSASLGNTDCAVALVEPTGPSREIQCWRQGNYILFAEDRDVAETWLQRVFDEAQLKKGRMIRTVLLWRDEALMPSQYPETNVDIARLLEEDVPDVLEGLFKGIRDAKAGTVPVLICCKTKNGPGLAAVDLTPPVEPTGKKKTRRAKVSHGFRSVEKMPLKLLGQRYVCGTAKVVRRGVNRVDPQWILNRGGGGFGELYEKHVCVIGCGSIGAAVAWQLAQAGVGQLTVVDHDAYSWDNAARHILPGTDVGKNKACALAAYIMRQMPQVDVDACETRWEDAWDRKDGILKVADLLISCTGIWESELALNVLKRKGALRMPMLFAWAEAHALVGHSLLVMDTGGCLACGMGRTGVFARRALNVPEEQAMARAPACGGFFQPYGVVNISATRRMVTEHAVQCLLGKEARSSLRSWVASNDALAGKDAELRPEFCAFFGETECADRVMEAEWPIDDNCQLCAKG